MRQVELCSAWVIHARNYRDNDMLVDVLTRTAGRVSAVLHGARSRRRRRLASIQPGQPLLVAWSGRSSGLKTLNVVESDGAHREYPGRSLFALLYLNELLYRLLPELDSCARVFDAYSACLDALRSAGARARHGVLRDFELVLLRELGYGVDFSCEEDGRTSIRTDAYYRFEPARGFILTPPVGNGPAAERLVFSGAALVRLRAQGAQDLECLALVRAVARATFQYVLGKRRLGAYNMFSSQGSG